MGAPMTSVTTVTNSHAGVSAAMLFVVNGVGPWASLSFAAAAIVTNCLLIATTIRTKSLRSACNLLIAFDALCSAIGQISLFVNTLKPTISVATCYLLCVPSSMAIAALALVTLFLSLERLLAVLAPIWSISRKQKRVAHFFIGVSLFAGALVELRYTLAMLASPWTSAVCDGSIQFTPAQIALLTTYNNANFWGSVAAYAALWVVLRYRESKASSPHSTTLNASRRIFPALTAIIGFSSIAWSLPAVAGWFCDLTSPGPDLALFMQSFVGRFATLGTALTPVALFAFCTEYKKSFNKLLRSCFKCIYRSSPNSRFVQHANNRGGAKIFVTINSKQHTSRVLDSNLV